TGRTVRSELGHARSIFCSPEFHRYPGGTGDCVIAEVDDKTVLGEHGVLGRGWLGLALGLDVGVGEAGLDLTGPIGGVAVDAGSLVIALLGVVGHWLLGAAAVLDCGTRDLSRLFALGSLVS